MANKQKTVFCCTDCGYETPNWSGKCPSCGAALSGIKGETTKCPYCGTFYTF